MASPAPPSAQDETQVLVRYWASARAAAGVDEDRIEVAGPVSLAEVRDRAVALHPDADRLADVVKACSVLLDDEPLGRRDPETVLVRPGMSVEFLPPFAGG